MEKEKAQSLGERSGQLIWLQWLQLQVPGGGGRGEAAMGKEGAGDVMWLYKATILYWKG